MDTVKAELVDFSSLKDLKPLLATKGPCISIYMPLANAPAGQSAKANALQWKTAIRTLTEKEQQDGAKVRDLLQGMTDFDALVEGNAPRGKGIAVFRAPELFRAVELDEPVRTRAVVGPHPYIRPLLRELASSKNFYLLALSQKNVRLLRCDFRSSEEIALPAGTADNYDAYMNTAKPDHVRDNRSSPGPSSGSSKGVMFSTSSDREDKDEYLAHFFRQIDRGVNEVLRGRNDPLVLAGVEYELKLYRDVNTSPHLSPEAVQGAPNSLKSGEMHARAIDALSRAYDRKLNDVLAEYNHKVGGGASNKLKDVVTAAHDGRIVKLIVSDSLEQTGAFDENAHAVKGRETGGSRDEDLVNDAAIQTITHGGQVLVAPNSKMPHGSPVAAVFRF